MIEEAPEEIKKFRLSHVYEPLLIRWQRLGEHQNLFMLCRLFYLISTFETYIMFIGRPIR